MPQYVWKDKKTGTTITVIRQVADIEVKPLPEEIDLPDAEWERQLCAPVNRYRFND